ncbi:AAA family ATPase [Nocardiopsis dassonvillei]|uniref:AAA family ATPase n=1 Tax=Nocardiopsis dassonvillei TaxID=2014 RepID=UPI0033C07221
MAVLTAIAVIVAALVFAETVLVYVALGLAGVSVLLLLGALLQGRSGGGGGPDRTDGLGKASVPVMAATAASAVPIAHVESENPGRVPAPASEPVREPHVPERPAWPTPVAEDAGHGEPEYDVPRWQTPTAHDWPEPDTAAHDAAPSAPHTGPIPSWASSEEERPLRAPALWESGTGAADTAARSEWDESSGTTAEDGPDTGDGTGERTAAASGAAFTYDIPGRTPPADDGPSAEDRPPFGEDAVGEDIDDAPFTDAPDEHGGRERGGSAFASEEPFVYSIPRPAQAVEENFPGNGDDDSVGADRDAAPSAHDVPGDGDQDGDGAGTQGTDTSDRASFAYDIPGRSAAEGTAEEDAFAEGGDDGDRPDDEESGAFAYDVPGVSSAEDASSPGDGSRAARDAVEEDIDDAPSADAPERSDAEEPGEDTATAGTPEPDEASVPAADHEDARDTVEVRASERPEEADEDSEPADDREDAPEAHATEQALSVPGADGDGPETAVLPVVSGESEPEDGHAPGSETAVLPVISADSEPEEERAPDGDPDDAGTDAVADSTGDGARTDDEADERAADADDDSDGGGGGAFSYRVPRGGDGDEDGARAGDVPTAAEPDQGDTGEDGSAARTERPADGAEDGPDEDGARDTADRASHDDASDTKR